MNLYAYMTEKVLKSSLSDYIRHHYGAPPRERGALLMRFEEPTDNPCDIQEELFNSFCGKDVVFIHTRCGGCGNECDEDSNYQACGGREWEERNQDTFIAHITDLFDSTYMDHYFKAVLDDEYEALLKEMSESREQLGGGR